MKTQEQKIEILKENGIVGKLWISGDKVRFYVTECNEVHIFNTPKTKQSVFFDLNTNSISCFTNCNSQPFKWCANENERVINGLSNLTNLLS